MSWWNNLGNLLQSGAKENQAGAPGPQPQAPGNTGGRGADLSQTARRTEGFDAQEALFRPPGGPGERPAGGTNSSLPAAERGGQRGPQPAPGQTPDKTPEQAPTAAVAEPDLPKDFTQEGVLATWITQFNASLAKLTDRSGRNPKLAQLKALGWADGQGLNIDLLKAAAAVWKPKAKRASSLNAEPEQKEEPKAAPPAATTAQVLAMLASNNGVLRKVIDKEYPGKCLQFSEKMMAEMGARRADGSDKDREKRKAKKGPLTAKYRGLHMKELPKDLPPGYQICIVSMPEWGFTEVGNHWFVSAGEGFYADNTGGIFDGKGMTSNLRNAAAEQWAGRVVDKDFGGGYAKIRAEMGVKFVEANPQFARYAKSGRTLVEKQQEIKVKRDGKTVREANPDFKEKGALEAEGFAAIKAFVIGNEHYHPRVWVVEPTAKAE